MVAMDPRGVERFPKKNSLSILINTLVFIFLKSWEMKFNQIIRKKYQQLQCYIDILYENIFDLF
jgi:hypothetical protein